MVRARGGGLWLVAACALAACGGNDAGPAPGTPAAEPPPPGAQAAARDTAPAMPQVSMELSREVFAYRGAGRDPFLSLLKSGGVRPLPEDLRVRGINYDARYPQRSVATLQDASDGRRYTVRAGDVIGRIRIVEVRQTEVIAVIEEFGVDRQLVLPIRRRQEDTP